MEAHGSSPSNYRPSSTPHNDIPSTPPSLNPATLDESPSRATARRRSWSRGTTDGRPSDPLTLDLHGRMDNWRTDEPDRYGDSPNDSSHAIVSPRADTRSPYASEAAIPSFTSLDSETGSAGRDDDAARLTGNPEAPDEGWGHHSEDAERSGATGLSPRNRRRTTLRYNSNPSPLRSTGSALKTVSRNIRRVSVRVVNLANGPGDTSVRLPDDDDEERPPNPVEEETIVDQSDALPIRGRTLIFFGPTSRVRLALRQIFLHPITEPLILILIICNAVVLTIQSAPTSILSPNSTTPVPVLGYFHTWQDYALFTLFVIFTLEAFGRICLSGFMLDPEIRTRRMFTSPFSSYVEPPPASNTSSNSANAAPLLKRGFTTRLRDIRRNIERPFTLEPRTARAMNASTTTLNNASRTTLQNVNDAQDMDTAFSEKFKSPQAQGYPLAQSYASNPNNSQKSLSTGAKSGVVSLPFKLNVTHIQDKVIRNVPYLRNSWNRIDFVAIFSFWVAFVLATVGVERGQYHIGVFRALSVLRTARLLAVSSGTTTIMRSLKTARPLLASVAYFVVFAMVLFSIIGVQSFKGSLRRTCWLQPTLGEQQTQLPGQFCGGHIDPATMQNTGFIALSGNATNIIKGYICPLGQVCMESENPNTNVESFDTIYFAALQVVIVASANGWSPLMYSIIDSESFVSCLFFILCVMVLNYWLINLFVAVITNTFAAIRSDSSKSAFGAAPVTTVKEDQEEIWALERRAAKGNFLTKLLSYTKWFWVLLALASLVLQATRSSNPSGLHLMILNNGELGITLAFDLEIVIRFLANLPDWRSFFLKGNNWLDLVLAIATSIIQIPAIHDSPAYPWLTIFQLARFYRVILIIPRMKPLMLAVFGNMYGLVNMSLFLLLVIYIAALVAIQLVRGDMSGQVPMNFGQIFTGFLGMYQIFSSENWTTVLYDTTQAEIPLGQAAILALFLSFWLLFANFIILQMFIAVINENFSIAEESKRSQQATNYWASSLPAESRASWLRNLNPYRWLKAAPVSVQVEHLPSGLVLPMQQSLVEDYVMPADHTRAAATTNASVPVHYTSKSLTLLQSLFTSTASQTNDIPLSNIRHARKASSAPGVTDDETERYLDILAGFATEEVAAEDLNDAIYERRALRADFIRDHPSFDKTFWFFGQDNKLRQWCQKLVEPANGTRIYGQKPSPVAHPLLQLLLLLAVIGGLVTEFIATPPYRRDFYRRFGVFRGSWFDITEIVFCGVLVVEFLIKVIADGFLFTPNAYAKSIWNVLDFLILAGLIVNVTTAFIFIGGLSRLTRSLKALRALRLITLIEKMRDTFQSLILSGVARILDAAVLAILYMIPYAVWGLNIFAGQLYECNDTSVNGLSDCGGEYSNTVYGNTFGFLVPRVWDQPSPSTTFSFDTFRSSLLILFEIVSLEGWTDVMNAVTSIVGPDQQPQTNSSQANAIYFLVYHLLGGVVILTLFVSIIIGNFSSKTGSAFLTQPQREWIDLQKLIQRQKPSKRPRQRPTWAFRAWCYDRATQKHGWWSRAMTILFVVHIFALMTQTFSTQRFTDELRRDFFLAVTMAYVIDILVRSFGLGWNSFRADGWNIFDVVVAGGSFVTVLLTRFAIGGYVVLLLQNIFLVSIAFKLVQRTNSLNKLFKTSVASLPVIISLLALWLILFLFFAILFVEVFSLTKWGSGETRNQNYNSIGTALVMLTFMTTGEGWNQYMHDYTISFPRCTLPTSTESDTDCGSTSWAFSLFIAWNLLSMYIFTNMFTGVVVENFSYVFQSAGASKTITREEMRAFKKVWAEFANNRTGYLERNRFVPFFAKLTGVFEVKIYPSEFSTPNIMASCQGTLDHAQKRPRVVAGIDLRRLRSVLGAIDFAAIRKRRALYSRLYHEANITHEPGKGISFLNMLHLLAHHKLIVDRDALVLKDLLIRTETNKLVTDLVNLDKVRSLLKMISLRRRFLAHRERMYRERSTRFGIPAIVVGNLSPASPTPSSTRDITSPYLHGQSSPDQQSVEHLTQELSPISPVEPSVRNTALQRNRNRRVSDNISMFSNTDSARRRESSTSLDENPDEVIQSMQNSMWGDLLLEAEDEET